MELITLLTNEEYKQKEYLQNKEHILYTWNTLKQNVDNFSGLMMVIDSNKLNLESLDSYTGSLEPAIKYIEEFSHKGCTHVLMNTSMIDENWCYHVLKKYIRPSDEVCVFALSFFDDTRNVEDWNKQYAPGQGIWYRANTDVFFRYGIKKEQIHWVNYFNDSRVTIIQKVLSSNIILFTGGAPDLMMKRIKELKLKKILKNYQGLMIGYSAGAMIQLNEYHITPDEDYPEFKYLNGLGCIDDFKVEVHYHASKIQKESIERVQKEKGQTVYALYEDGGLIVNSRKIELFGKVDTFE